MMYKISKNGIRAGFIENMEICETSCINLALHVIVVVQFEIFPVASHDWKINFGLGTYLLTWSDLNWMVPSGLKHNQYFYLIVALKIVLL